MAKVSTSTSPTARRSQSTKSAPRALPSSPSKEPPSKSAQSKRQPPKTAASGANRVPPANPITSSLTVLDGVTLSKIEIEQSGDVHVEVDLPTHDTQRSLAFRTDVLARRSFDLYEDAELMQAAQAFFSVLRRRFEEPRAERAQINCLQCQEARCCREYEVNMSEADVVRLEQHLGKKRSALKHAVVSRPDWTGDFPFRLGKDEDAVGEKCVFLQRDDASGQMRCSIYHARPTLCRSFDERDCTLFDDNGTQIGG